MTTLIYILTGILFLIAILAIIAPKSYDLFRSIEITGSKTEIFEYLKYLKNQEKWSPWQKKDPNMDKKFTGADGEVGAISYWNGNKEVGEGEQELTKIVEGERVEGQLRFFKPFKSTSDCYMQLDEVSSDVCKVTWGFSGKNKFPTSIIMLFMNMDKAVGKDFEEGLQDLKEIIES